MFYNVYWDEESSVCASIFRVSIRGGLSLGKCIPLLVWHCKTPTLTGTKFAKPYPYWYKIWAQIHTLTGTNLQRGFPVLCHNYNCWNYNNCWCWRIAPQIWPILRNFFYILHSPWHNQWKNHIAWKPFPLWHWSWPKWHPSHPSIRVLPQMGGQADPGLRQPKRFITKGRKSPSRHLDIPFKDYHLSPPRLFTMKNVFYCFFQISIPQYNCFLGCKFFCQYSLNRK